MFDSCDIFFIISISFKKYNSLELYKFCLFNVTKERRQGERREEGDIEQKRNTNSNKCCRHVLRLRSSVTPSNPSRHVTETVSKKLQNPIFLVF